MNKKEGQSQISFGMIFAIILIVVFIAFAVYGVVKILHGFRIAQVATFKSDFQLDINDMWTSTQGSQKVEYPLPRSIEQVCFINRRDENMYFIPNDFQGEILEHLNISGTIAASRETPKRLCIDTADGKISMTLKKAYNQALVTVTK